MSKTGFIFTTLFLMLLLFGCASSGPSSKPAPEPSTLNSSSSTTPMTTTTALESSMTIVMEMSEATKEEISKAWLAANAEDLDWDAKNDVGDDRIQYHGAYNGKHILVFVENSQIADVAFDLYIGPYVLSCHCPFEIYVYENGQFTTLEAAYTQEIFTAEEIETIFAHLEAVFPID